MEKTKRFDPKEFCSFVVKYLPKEEKYLHSFNFSEEIEDMHSVLNGKEDLTIFIIFASRKPRNLQFLGGIDAAFCCY